MLNFWIPSTNTSSSTPKGYGTKVENPKVGVVIKQVKIPVELDKTFWILIPLVLFVANSFTDFSGRPFGCRTILTESIEFPDSFASIFHYQFLLQYQNLQLLQMVH